MAGLGTFNWLGLGGQIVNEEWMNMYPHEQRSKLQGSAYQPQHPPLKGGQNLVVEAWIHVMELLQASVNGKTYGLVLLTLFFHGNLDYGNPGFTNWALRRGVSHCKGNPPLGM